MVNEHDFCGSNGEKSEGNVSFRKVGGKIVFNGRTVKGPICYGALTTIGPVCMPCVLTQNFRGIETRMSSTVFVQTMRIPLSSRSDA